MGNTARLMSMQQCVADPAMSTRPMRIAPNRPAPRRRAWVGTGPDHSLTALIR